MRTGTRRGAHGVPPLHNGFVFSVLIVSYRTPDLTRAAVRSALDIPQVTEVVVVDNASGDDTIEQLRDFDDPRLRLIEHGTNVGFGAGHNAAARAATGDSLLLLNSDALLTAEAVACLEASLARDAHRSIVAPRLITPDRVIQRSAGLLPTPLDLSIRSLGLHSPVRGLAQHSPLRSLIGHLPFVREHASAETATDTMETTMVSGACFAIGREAFWELGGFDERFFMYFEDADLCRRASAAGMPIRYVPSAVVTHIGGASSSEDYHFGPLHARAMRQYLGKWYGHGGSALAVLLLWLRAVGMTVALRQDSRRAWRAFWAALRDHDPRP